MGAVQATLLTIVPESPAYLYKIGKKEEARKALIKLRAPDDIEEEFSGFAGTSDEGMFLVFHLGAQGLIRSAGPEAEPLLSATQKIVGLAEFATARKYRWSLMLVVGIMLAQQFTGGSYPIHLFLNSFHLITSIRRLPVLIRDFRDKRGRDVRSCDP